MNAHLQRVEGQRVALGYRKLAVDHELPLGQRADHRYDFGEIARKRLAGFRPEIDFFAGAVGETTEAVPFRLKLPAGLVGQLADELRLDGLKTKRHG